MCIRDRLVNITGGEDLKLFEVDEVVNKIRAEVDPEAEVIIGAITSGDLDGKIIYSRSHGGNSRTNSRRKYRRRYIK